MCAGDKDSEYGKFHTNQALVLNLASIVVGIVLKVISIPISIIPLLGGMINTALAAVVGIGTLIFWLIAFIGACQGEMKELPLIGSIKIIN